MEELSRPQALSEGEGETESWGEEALVSELVLVFDELGLGFRMLPHFRSILAAFSSGGGGGGGGGREAGDGGKGGGG